MAVWLAGALGAMALASGGGDGLTPQPPALHGVFMGPAGETLETIAQGCLREGEAIASRTGESVTCESPLGAPERIAARVLLRSPFLQQPHAFVRFAVTSEGAAGSAVQVFGWAQGEGGRSGRTVNLAGSRFDEHLRAFLQRLGARAIA